MVASLCCAKLAAGKCTGTDRSMIESSADHEPMAAGHLWWLPS